MVQPVAVVDVARGLRELVQALVREAPRLEQSRTAAGTLAALESAGPLSVTALARRELVTQPAMTGIVQRLEALGQVRRTTSAHDRRMSVIELTTEGRRAIADRRAQHDGFLAARIAGLSAEHRDALRAALPAMAALCSAER